MFQYTAPYANRVQSRCEAAPVLANVLTRPATPTLARWMRDHWMRSSIEARVALFIPWIDVFEPEVTPSSCDE
jgi:hypothetical protein